MSTSSLDFSSSIFHFTKTKTKHEKGRIKNKGQKLKQKSKSRTQRQLCKNSKWKNVQNQIKIWEKNFKNKKKNKQKRIKK